MDAKTLLALANLNKRDRYLEKSVAQTIAPKRDWRWVGYDATTGQGIVSNGVITGRGKVITNGSIVPGEIVGYSQDGEFAVIEAKPYVRPKPAPKPQYVPKPAPSDPSIAILFSAYKDGSANLGFYVGGLTPEPIEIETPADLSSANSGYTIDNLGEGNYYIAVNQFAGNVGILGRWIIPNNDLKISPQSQVPEGRIHIRWYVGAGIFVGLTDFDKGATVLFFDPTPGVGGVASWTNGVRIDSATVQYPIVVSATGSYLNAPGPLSSSIPDNITGNGFYVLPNGTQVAVSYTKTTQPGGGAINTSYVSARTLFAEDANTFLYSVDTFVSSTNYHKKEYFYVNNATPVKVAESVNTGAASQQVATLGNPLQIENMALFRTGPRLVDAKLYDVRVNGHFNLGEPSDPSTGSYTVDIVDLFGGVSTAVYQVEPIPQNYVIPASPSGGGVRIWNASFNFQ